jgi:hypothetical protein
LSDERYTVIGVMPPDFWGGLPTAAAVLGTASPKRKRPPISSTPSRRNSAFASIQKKGPVAMIYVDHIEKTPTEN